MNNRYRTGVFPVLLCAFGLVLWAGGCGKTDSQENSKDSEQSPTPAYTAASPAPQASPTDTGGLKNEPIDMTPSVTPSVPPTEVPSPTPIRVNTDTSTVTFLVNREHPLPEGFVPEGLTTPDILFPFSDTSIDKAKMTPEAGEALAKLFDAAYEEAGLTLYGISAYRSYARQYTIYATNLITQGVAHTNRYSAAPGQSEHQTGLAIDISCASEKFGLETTFALTPEGIWVAENAHRFGFILRYPKDKEHITGYNYEPWHLRYVGTELAAHLYRTGLTLDEYYGVPSTLASEYLDVTPLIDTETPAYLAIYAQYYPAQSPSGD